MSSFFSRRPARNVYNALNWCNPKYSIEYWLEEFYVDRGKDSPREAIKEHLLSEFENPKILLAGPRGCGKNTEMLRLSQDNEIKRRFYIKFFPGVADINLLIGKMLQNVVDVAKEIGLEDVEAVREANDFLLFRSSWNEIVEVTAVPEREVFNERWVDNSRFGDKRATVTKKKPAEVDPLTMSIWINKITAEIEKKKKKHVLLIVVGMDKLDYDKLITLFKDKAVSLNGVKCFIIFTFPAELYFNPTINAIRRNYSEIYYLPNLSHWQLGTAHDENYSRLRAMMERRVSYDLFDPAEKTIDQIIHYSGGVPYELIDLLRHGALISSRQTIPWWWYHRPFWYIWILFLSPRRQKIKANDFEAKVIQRRQKIYNNSLTENQKKLLTDIKNKAKVDLRKPEHKELYDNNLIILYGKEDNMSFAVNPILDSVLNGSSDASGSNAQQHLRRGDDDSESE